MCSSSCWRVRGVHGHLDAEEEVNSAQILRRELKAKLVDDVMQKVRCLGNQDYVVDVQQEMCLGRAMTKHK